MDDIAKEIIPINIEEELKNSYMEYAMSVIVGRALPDARDTGDANMVVSYSGSTAMLGS